MERIGGGGALGVSRSGTVVVGAGPSDDPRAGSEAYRWSAGEGAVRLGFPPDGILYPEEGRFSSRATDVSADGSVVVGYSQQDANEFRSAFRWTAAGDDDRLPLLDIANAVSSDGATVVGQSKNFDNDFFGWWPREAALREGGSFVRLGFLQPVPTDPDPFEDPRDERWSSALGISDEGVVVGLSCESVTGSSGPLSLSGSGCAAFLWDSASGIRDLQEVLEEQTGLDLTGWTLTSAIDITPDGRTIVGTAIDPSGATEAWIAFLPEPGAASLLALGLGGLAARRRLHG
jgi:probable HAF family extracellular repeat protein